MKPSTLAAQLREAAERIESAPDFAEFESAFFADSYRNIVLSWETFERIFAEAEYWRDGEREYMEAARGEVRYCARRDLAGARVPRRQVSLPGSGWEAAHAACEV